MAHGVFLAKVRMVVKAQVGLFEALQFEDDDLVGALLQPTTWYI